MFYIKKRVSLPNFFNTQWNIVYYILWLSLPGITTVSQAGQQIMFIISLCMDHACRPTMYVPTTDVTSFHMSTPSSCLGDEGGCPHRKYKMGWKQRVWTNREKRGFCCIDKVNWQFGQVIITTNHFRVGRGESYNGGADSASGLTVNLSRGPFQSTKNDFRQEAEMTHGWMYSGGWRRAVFKIRAAGVLAFKRGQAGRDGASTTEEFGTWNPFRLCRPLQRPGLYDCWKENYSPITPFHFTMPKDQLLTAL